jgi:hypothetical protein
MGWCAAVAQMGWYAAVAQMGWYAAVAALHPLESLYLVAMCKFQTRPLPDFCLKYRIESNELV